MRVPCPRCSNGWMVPKYGEQTCIICGHMVMNPIETVISDIPARSCPIDYRTQAHHIAIQFYDSIKRQRKSGHSWETVHRLLKLSGFPCRLKTLKKYFEIEHAKRQKTKAVA